MKNQIKMPAVYMRGGTSKGIFFKQAHLSRDVALRDRVIQTVLGSSDAYGKQIDGMGGATSVDPAGAGGKGGVLPTREVVSSVTIPEVGTFQMSLIDAGNPTIFMRAQDLGLRGTELPNELNSNAELLARLETIRAHATVRMGLERQRLNKPAVNVLLRQNCHF